jgi:hypothetical protein
VFMRIEKGGRGEAGFKNALCFFASSFVGCRKDSLAFMTRQPGTALSSVWSLETGTVSAGIASQHFGGVNWEIPSNAWRARGTGMNEIQDNSQISGFPGSLVSNLGINVLTRAGPGCGTSTGFPQIDGDGEACRCSLQRQPATTTHVLSAPSLSWRCAFVTVFFLRVSESGQWFA